MKSIWKGVNAEKGATVIEYAILVALIIGVLIITIIVLGNKVEGTYNQTDKELTSAGM